MKRILTLTLYALAMTSLYAQTNPAPVRLAIISESPETAAAADLLTTEFSKNDRMHLVERAHIEKVIREQQLSLNNLDRLKLGQLLGADGLLALQSASEGEKHFVSAQLVAVRPGVLLAGERFDLPIQDADAWAANAVHHLEPALPKLGVQPGEAIPLSVVNFHSAIQNIAGAGIEKQLSFLTMERLMHESRVFVLERARMQALSDEKNMAGAEMEPFWNGKYLLEATIDRDGSAPDVVTLSARMTPPGGEPILIEASGSRTNYADAANQLVDKVLAALKLNPNPSAWNTADEANKFFKESQWNLAWKNFPQAQRAAEAAWALGKHDADCMSLRVRTFMPPPDGTVTYFPPREKPAAAKIDAALQATRLYQEFSHDLPANEPKPDSDWYKLGLENLIIATRVLQQFNWSPDYYQPVAGKLAELRTETRSLAELLSRSPAVHDSYYVGSRVVPYDDLYHFCEKPSIYGLKVEGGCLWQETPEAEIALYREVMSSPVFCYLHERLWFRKDNSRLSLPRLPPRLIAWNETDQKHIPTVWKDFLAELAGSTNIFLQMEAKALRLADTKARNEQELTNAFNDFFDAFAANRAAFKTNNVDVLYLDWHVRDLAENMGGDIFTPVKESLQNYYRTEYPAKLAAKDAELQLLHLQSQPKPQPVTGSVEIPNRFEQQKKFLQDNQPFEPRPFMELFLSGFMDCSPAQAEELKVLLAEYKKHLSGSQVRMGENMVRQAEMRTDHILNPRPAVAAHQPNQAVGTNGNPFKPPGGGFPPLDPYGRPRWLGSNGMPPPFGHQTSPPPAQPEPAVEPPAPEPLLASNIVSIKTFHAMPMDGFPGDDIDNFKFTDHQVIDGKVVLDFQFLAAFVSFNEHGGLKSALNKTFTGAAVFAPDTGNWLVAVRPDPVTLENRNIFPHHSTLWHDELYFSENGKIQKFDAKNHVWITNTLAVDGNYQLCNLDGHLYVTDYSTIQEIIGDGRSTKLLASIQRQPSISTLDTGGALMKLTLFADANHALHASVHDKVYTWTGTDWQTDCNLPAAFYPELFTDGVLFRSHAGTAGGLAAISRLPGGRGSPEIFFSARRQSPNNSRPPNFGTQVATAVNSNLAVPPWKTPSNLFVIGLPATLQQSNLFLLIDHAEKKYTANNYGGLEDMLPKDGYHASLLRYSPNEARPKKVLLKFEPAEGCAPLSAMNPAEWQMFPQLPATWMLFAGKQFCVGLQLPIKSQFMGVADYEQMPGRGRPPGIWTIPADELEKAFLTATLPVESLTYPEKADTR